MVRRAVRFTFPPELIKKPIVYNLGGQFKVVDNIGRADVNGAKGWVVLGLEGKVDDIERGIAWVAGEGVRVDSITGDSVEG